MLLLASGCGGTPAPELTARETEALQKASTSCNLGLDLTDNPGDFASDRYGEAASQAGGANNLDPRWQKLVYAMQDFSDVYNDITLTPPIGSDEPVRAPEDLLVDLVAAKESVHTECTKALELGGDVDTDLLDNFFPEE